MFYYLSIQRISQKLEQFLQLCGKIGTIPPYYRRKAKKDYLHQQYV